MVWKRKIAKTLAGLKKGAIAKDCFFFQLLPEGLEHSHGSWKTRFNKVLLATENCLVPPRLLLEIWGMICLSVLSNTVFCCRNEKFAEAKNGMQGTHMLGDYLDHHGEE